jgi:tetratricopeptide (TPR) repeat protein
VLGDLEHFREAEKVALSCLEVATAKGYVYRLAAGARVGLGDLEGALQYLETSIQRGLSDVNVRLQRAAVLKDLGRLADARRELLRAQQGAPMDARVLQALQQLAAPRNR